MQVAHLASAGRWEDEGARQAFEALADAVAHNDPRTRLLYFDVTAVGAPASVETARWWARMIRRAGVDRVVFGSDAATPSLTPGEALDGSSAPAPANERRIPRSRHQCAAVHAIAQHARCFIVGSDQGAGTPVGTRSGAQ